MTTIHAIVIASYHTHKGKLALSITRVTSKIDGRVWYRYSGLYGAGSGMNVEDMRKNVKQIKIAHPKMILVSGEMD